MTPILNIVIISVILAGITIHRYLSTFQEQDMLPYPMGFLLFANLFALTYLISFIWMFDPVAGVVVFILCYFQIVYSAGLWVFSLPWLINMHKNLTIPRVNPLVYGGFSFLVSIVAILTAVNFFVSPYQSIWDSMDGERWIPMLLFLALLAVGNLARITVMSRMVKE